MVTLPADPSVLVQRPNLLSTNLRVKCSQKPDLCDALEQAVVWGTNGNQKYGGGLKEAQHTQTQVNQQQPVPQEHTGLWVDFCILN